jgi:hypothetical protein
VPGVGDADRVGKESERERERERDPRGPVRLWVGLACCEESVGRRASREFWAKIGGFVKGGGFCIYIYIYIYIDITPEDAWGPAGARPHREVVCLERTAGLLASGGKADGLPERARTGDSKARRRWQAMGRTQHGQASRTGRAWAWASMEMSPSRKTLGAGSKQSQMQRNAAHTTRYAPGTHAQPATEPPPPPHSPPCRARWEAAGAVFPNRKHSQPPPCKTPRFDICRAREISSVFRDREISSAAGGGRRQEDEDEEGRRANKRLWLSPFRAGDTAGPPVGLSTDGAPGEVRRGTRRLATRPSEKKAQGWRGWREIGS